MNSGASPVIYAVSGAIFLLSILIVVNVLQKAGRAQSAVKNPARGMGRIRRLRSCHGHRDARQSDRASARSAPEAGRLPCQPQACPCRWQEFRAGGS